MEEFQLLQPGFSTADAEYPSFTFNDDLVLEFVDWREQTIRVRFAETAGVRWQELDLSHPHCRDDSVYEVANSQWLAQYLAQGARTEKDGLRHFRLGFNACGTLEVLAKSMSSEPEHKPIS